jgi:hypothetical protein
MTREQQALFDARAALAKFADAEIGSDSKIERHSKLVAKYVAAAIREDRASRRPASLFDLVFGPDR